MAKAELNFGELSGGGGQWFYQGTAEPFLAQTGFSVSDNCMFRLTASYLSYNVIILIRIFEGTVTVLQNTHPQYLTNISYSNGTLYISNELTAGIDNNNEVWAIGF